MYAYGYNLLITETNILCNQHYLTMITPSYDDNIKIISQWKQHSIAFAHVRFRPFLAMI